MTTGPKVVWLIAISVALMLIGDHAFAKSGGSPSQVKTSGTSAAPSGAGGSRSKYVPYCKLHPGRGGCPPKADQPPCRGGHMGPNGVMIQCQ
jgi:hypothetical protein